MEEINAKSHFKAGLSCLGSTGKEKIEKDFDLPTIYKSTADLAY